VAAHAVAEYLEQGDELDGCDIAEVLEELFTATQLEWSEGLEEVFKTMQLEWLRSRTEGRQGRPYRNRGSSGTPSAYRWMMRDS
jgi:hypothetical protein